MSHADKHSFKTRREAHDVAQSMATKSNNPVWVYHRGSAWYVSGCVNLFGHCPRMPRFDHFMEAYSRFTYEQPVPLPDVYYVMYTPTGMKMTRGNHPAAVSQDLVEYLLRRGNVLVMSHAPEVPNSVGIQRELQYSIGQPVAWRDLGKRTLVLYSHPEDGVADHTLSNGRFVYDALTTTPMVLPREDMAYGEDPRERSQRQSRCNLIACHGLQHNPYNGWIWQERNG